MPARIEPSSRPARIPCATSSRQFSTTRRTSLAQRVLEDSRGRNLAPDHGVVTHLLGVVQLGEQSALERVVARGARGRALRQRARRRLLARCLQRGLDQAGAAFEVVVEERGGHARGCGDLVDLQPAHAVAARWCASPPAGSLRDCSQAPSRPLPPALSSPRRDPLTAGADPAGTRSRSLHFR